MFVRARGLLFLMGALALAAPLAAQDAGSTGSEGGETAGPELSGEEESMLAPPPGGGGSGDANYTPGPIPPEKFAVSPGGVDMRSASYRYEAADLSIGGSMGDGGLQLKRESAPPSRRVSGKFYPFGNQSHNWYLPLVERRIGRAGAQMPAEYDFQLSAQFNGLSATFRSFHFEAEPHELQSNNGFATLTWTGTKAEPTSYRYEDTGGNYVIYDVAGDCPDFGASRCWYPSEAKMANGTRFTFGYTSYAGKNYLRRVTSNAGFALHFDYLPPSDNVTYVAFACVRNVAEVYAAPTTPCPQSDAATMAYSYSDGKIVSAGRVGVAPHSFGYDAPVNGQFQVRYYNPSEPVPFLTNTVRNGPINGHSDYVVSQLFGDGTTMTYDWSYYSQPGALAPDIAGGTFTDSANASVTVEYGFYDADAVDSPNDTIGVTPGPEKVTDQNGQESISTYCVTSPTTGLCMIRELQTRTDAEGIKRQFTYDGLRNVIETRTKAAPSSGLPDMVTTSVYGCTAPVCSNKPTSVTDASGSVTSYTYDAVHGGVLSETGPQVDGVAPVKRSAYVQRYAWVKASGAGYVQAATPIWLLAEERTCRTTATAGNACAGGAADEVVTAYDYGPDSGPNNLLLRGVAVSADGTTLRTCYGYDNMGRRISETAAAAGLAVCP